MTKHPYQTCLRMPLTLKEDMTTICDEYQVNESDLMRKAIAQFITNIRTNPEETSRYMFVWYVSNHISLIMWDGLTHTAHIQRISHRKRPLRYYAGGSFLSELRNHFRCK